MRWRLNVEDLRTEQLAQLDRFRDLSGKDIQRVVKAGARVVVPKGSRLTTEDSAGEGVYVILSGEVEVARGGVRLGTLSPGDIVGEVAVLEGLARTADVIAATNVEALRLSNQAVRTLYQKVASFRRVLDDAVFERRRNDALNDE